MAMLEILNSVRRIVHKWVNTSSRIVSSIEGGASSGDTIIFVENVSRFSPGDEIIIRNNRVYEVDLSIESIDRESNTITLAEPVRNNWVVEDAEDGPTLITKCFYGNYVQGIYLGGRELISRFPAITINGISRSSEWMTLESTKEKYEVELTVYVQASTQEKGYKFLLAITDLIQKGLKKNLMPLVEDYNIVSLTRDVDAGDSVIYVTNREYMENNKFSRLFLEDEFNSQELLIDSIYDSTEDPTETALKISGVSCFNFDKNETSVIIPNRHIFNSWPNNIQYGHIHEKEMLKAAKISWFAEEEEIHYLRDRDPKLN